MREIKFRAWDGEKMREDFSLQSDGRIYQLSYLDDWVLMQYTGLKDKNGKKIYEGDIVRLLLNGNEPRIPYEIRWSKENSGFWVGSFYPLNKAMSQDYEVIGNIYENT